MSNNNPFLYEIKLYLGFCNSSHWSSKIPLTLHVLFSYCLFFSFFIWSCSVLMMMQIMRCESAVAQGLRSDKHPTCDKREQATSTPLTPLASWLQTSPLLTILAPKRPQISYNWHNNLNFLLYTGKYLTLSQLFIGSQMPNVYMEKSSHCLIRMTPNPFWDVMGAESLPGWCFRCSASGCCLQLFPLAIQQAQQRNDLC